MILFDLSLFDLLLYGNHKNVPFLGFKLGTENTRNDSNMFSSRRNHDELNPIFASSNMPLVSCSRKEFANSREKYRLIKRNFWQKLVNKYWQETIFISSSNPVLENYTSRLRTSGLSVYQGSDYKNFLRELSKNLLYRNIQIYSSAHKDRGISKFISKNNVYVKYKWLKLLNPGAFTLKNNKNKLATNFLINRNSKSFPLFVLINNKKQIVLAESSEYTQNRHTILEFYHRITSSRLNNKKLYTGLFFTNLDDATEYLNYINYKYSRSTRNLSIKLVPTTINLYYQLLEKSGNQIEFRLIPDLKEVSQLLYKYKKYKNLSFDSDQHYGSNYFQGQPLYFFKHYNLEIERTTNSPSHFRYLYALSKNHKVQYETAFLNYDTAFNAWQKYRKKIKKYNLPLKPQLSVLNLESFLIRSDYTNKNNKIIFIPSVKTYSFAKKYIMSNLDDSRGLIQLLINSAFNFKSVFYRVLWSLTTRQPIVW
uniref:Ycf80 n=1 Tax=Laurenciella marilzae TaxID=1413812 RepID=A0A1Z1M1U0_9FLOR|nr:hypothetical protein [Laurenciella marilzae]ARW59755.1 hypothetical protein [Laurenciella marilzae]